MQGMPVGEIARRLRLHRNTVSKRLKRPETQQLLAALLQELAERATTQTAERLEAARQAAQVERARKRALRQGQGAPYPGVRNIFDGHAPIKQYVARQR
jgi:IS30 family transposase